MAFFVLLLFFAAIAVVIFANVSLLWALVPGYCLFFCCALARGGRPVELARLSMDGVRTVFPVCSTLLCVGLLTAAWRASGTIAYLVSLSLELVTPAIFAPCVFLCNCVISFLLGSSFATCATMGVISMSVAQAIDCPPALAGGAVLAGCYFGDRCSPMSTSALLVCTLSGITNYRLLPAQMRSCVPAMILTVAAFALCSVMNPTHGDIPDTGSLFAREYRLSWFLTLPALMVILLGALRLHVRSTVLGSTLAAALLCLFVQNQAPADLAGTLMLGFTAADHSVGQLMNGGGLFSMTEVVAIVCLSSTYAGLFRVAGLLDGVHRFVKALRRFGTFMPYLGAGLLTSAIACNQTLAIMLTHQLTRPMSQDSVRHALDMEDSVVLLAAIVPWSIACSVAVHTMGAPMVCVPLAFYLWLLPLTRLFWCPAKV